MSQTTVDVTKDLVQFWHAQCEELGVKFEFFDQHKHRCTLTGDPLEDGGYKVEMGDHAADASRYTYSPLSNSNEGLLCLSHL